MQKEKKSTTKNVFLFSFFFIDFFPRYTELLNQLLKHKSLKNLLKKIVLKTGTGADEYSCSLSIINGIHF